MTPEALAALERSDVIVGYKTYVELVRPFLSHHQVISTGMKAEMERCKIAVERACLGQMVAVVSSGDSGIYGMAGLMLEVCQSMGLSVGPPWSEEKKDLSFEVIPGIPAFTGAAALLGAPLMHDFVSVSLSDLLTPWETIRRRIELAAEGDFVIVIYNPKSHKRDWQLDAARDIMLNYRLPQTPVGIVRNATRKGEKVWTTTLEDLPSHPVDMQTLVIVGNSTTYLYGPYLVTPRGYFTKYQAVETDEQKGVRTRP